MKIFSLLAVAILSVSLGLGAQDAEAKRLGGGRPLGMQRQIEAPKPVQPPTTAPAPAPGQAAPMMPPGAAAQTAAKKPSWLGPVAGLAAGLGLAALASHFGFGEELASLLLIMLVVMAVLAVVGLVMRKRAMAQQPALAGANGMRYQASEPFIAGSQSADAQPAPAAPGKVPADFDVAGFLRSAKVHYIRLQAANDAGNLDDLRAFTTPEMFAELKMDIAERGNVKQETDVLDIDAEVLEVVEEGDRYIASVRFTGHVREEKDGPVETVDEIWHLVKPRDGKSGWLLAGIQPV
ncbi:MAG: Tim44 domain-containing protein [Rhodocyclaceae bacterium]